jgi:hypothetical protein
VWQGSAGNRCPYADQVAFPPAIAWSLLAPLSELMWPCIWIASGLLVVRELHTSALSENVNTAFKNRPDDRNALPVCNAIRFNLN